MIAAHQIAFGKAAGKGLSAKDYIQYGLVAMWDGIENAGWGKFDNELRCVDLTANNEPIVFEGDVIRQADGFYLNSKKLTSGFGFGSSAVLPNDAVRTTSTVQVCASYPAKYNNWQGVFRYNNADIGVNAVYNYFYHKLGKANSASEQGLEWTFGEGVKNTNTVVITVGETTPVCYLNDIKSTDVLQNGRYRLNSYDRVLVGAGHDEALKPCCMVKHCVRLYSRALTAEEIAHNYKVDKARFGL
jgi:hypothetical protein